MDVLSKDLLPRPGEGNGAAARKRRANSRGSACGFGRVGNRTCVPRGGALLQFVFARRQFHAERNLRCVRYVLSCRIDVSLFHQAANARFATAQSRFRRVLTRRGLPCLVPFNPRLLRLMTSRNKCGQFEAFLLRGFVMPKRGRILSLLPLATARPQNA